jgi:hypothetical protein
MTIEQSYGRLSFAPEVVIDRTAPFLLENTGDSFSFHHGQSIRYIEEDLAIKTDGSEFFLIHIHTPLFQSKSPMVRS